MSKELDNVYEIKNAIKYLKGNPNIKEDSYSLEALYYIEKALTELEELKRYPTSDEVCEALSEELEDNVILFNGDFVAVEKGRVLVSRFDDGELLLQVSFKPHLITLIGRFYEGLEELKWTL